ncbi:putative malate dehydrogenase 1B [Gigantopelta aegis]|uniref:putative malate dehydrogenase 1B n=1 Tax=Gigantopelta aegis TaxID=1735272 RepID=UPI001B88BCA1|nr:putative malate dehydrogenase 1B [Gigantopelta aegis]
MAKFVIAGRADCPYYVRTELLGDRLERNLSDFKVHKIVKQPDDWENWLREVCEEKGWDHSKSPLVWRELIDRGGKGVLIGGANEFQEYVQAYYDLESAMTSDDMLKCADENLQTKIEVDVDQKELKSQSTPLHVCVTNASQPVSYSLVTRIVSGEVFGEDAEIALHLLDEKKNADRLSGMELEVYDLAEPLLRQVYVTSDPREAFADCSVIILLDSVDRQEEETRESWLERNADHFSNYAKIINERAGRNCKVLLSGSGPINFNAYMMIKNAPNVPRQNIVGLSRLVENRAKAVMGEKLKVNTADVVNVIVWGSVNGCHYIDVSETRVHRYDGAIWGPPSFSVSAVEMVHNTAWLEKDYIELVKSRHVKVESAVGRKCALAEACAITSMLKHWMDGSPTGQIFSLAIFSEGWYDVPEDLVFSFPVTLDPKGYWNVVQDITLTDETKAKLKLSYTELIEEKQVMFPPPVVELQESAKVSETDTQSNKQQTPDQVASGGTETTEGGQSKEVKEGEQEVQGEQGVKEEDTEAKDKEEESEEQKDAKDDKSGDIEEEPSQ